MRSGDVVSVGTPFQDNDSCPSAKAPRILLEGVNKPGAYVCHGTGDLIRVTGSGPTWVDAVPVQEDGNQSIVVTQVSGDPFVPITRARLAAADLDLEINF